jgi:hypothetical protein
VYTVLTYVQHGPTAIASGPYSTNNHILFSLLSWATTELLGHSEAVYRLWSVVPAFLAVVALCAWAWRRLGPPTAAAFAVLAALSPMHFEYMRDARGYGLALLAASLMLIAADALGRGRGRVALGGFVGAALAGIYTFPPFLLGFLGEAGTLATRRGLRQRALLAAAVTGAVSLALYSPVLGDLFNSSGQEHGRQLPWHAPLSAPVRELLAPSVALLLSTDAETAQALLMGGDAEAWSWIVAVGLIGLLALGIWRLRKRGEGLLAGLLVVPVVTSYALLAIGRFYVEPRFQSYLLLHVLVLAAVGLTELGSYLRWPRVRQVAVAGALVIAVIGAARIIDLSTTRAELPKENLERVGEVVNGTRIGRVLTDSLRPTGLEYYIDAPLQSPAPDDLQRDLCDGARPLVFVSHPWFRKPGDPPAADTDCLQARGAVRVRVAQSGRGRFIDVWVLSGAASAR